MKIAVIDDHPLSRDGLRHLLLGRWPEALIVEASDFSGARRIFDERPDLDLVLLDLQLPDLCGLDSLKAIRRDYGALPVAVVSGNEDYRVMREAAALGAVGYIPKSANGDATAMAIALILGGGTYFPRSVLAAETRHHASSEVPPRPALTTRQRVILEFLAVGRTNQYIAKRLGLSANTVRTHVSAILRTLGVSNRTEAAHAARALGQADAPLRDP